MTMLRTLLARAFGPRARLAVAFVLLVIMVGTFSWIAGDAVNRVLLYLPGVDKVLHFSAFAVLYIACDSLLQRMAPRLEARPFALTAVLVVVSLADEVAQSLQPSRSVEAADLVASIAGVLFGMAWTLRREHWKLATAVCLTGLLAAGTVTVESYTTQRFVNEAVWHARAGEFEAARHDYQQALEAGANPAHLYNELAWVEIESGVGDPRQAVRWSRQAFELHPDDPDVLDTHGWALHHAGRSAEALPFLERAYAEDPNMYCIHYHLGEAYLAVSDRARAEWHFRQQMRLEGTREAARAAAALRRMGAR